MPPHWLSVQIKFWVHALNCPEHTIPEDLGRVSAVTVSHDGGICVVQTDTRYLACFQYGSKRDIPSGINDINQIAIASRFIYVNSAYTENYCACGMTLDKTLQCVGTCAEALPEDIRTWGVIRKIIFGEFGSGCVVLEPDNMVRCWGVYKDVPEGLKVDQETDLSK